MLWNKAGHCKFYKSNPTTTHCEKWNVCLCFSKERNCFGVGVGGSGVHSRFLSCCSSGVSTPASSCTCLLPPWSSPSVPPELLSPAPCCQLWRPPSSLLGWHWCSFVTHGLFFGKQWTVSAWTVESTQTILQSVMHSLSPSMSSRCRSQSAYHSVTSKQPWSVYNYRSLTLWSYLARLHGTFHQLLRACEMLENRALTLK